MYVRTTCTSHDRNWYPGVLRAAPVSRFKVVFSLGSGTAAAAELLYYLHVMNTPRLDKTKIS